jgi:predicted RNA binding protein YcfA (HicA-like mRNA interferase family)
LALTCSPHFFSPILSPIYFSRNVLGMPPKIRQLKANLSKAGFTQRPAKGSHTYWTHSALPGTEITLSGKDGNDAKPYQIKDIDNAIRKLGGSQ